MGRRRPATEELQQIVRQADEGPFRGRLGAASERHATEAASSLYLPDDRFDDLFATLRRGPARAAWSVSRLIALLARGRLPCKSLGHAAYQSVVEYFSWETMSARYESLCSALVSGSRAV